MSAPGAPSVSSWIQAGAEVVTLRAGGHEIGPRPKRSTPMGVGRA